MLRDAEGAQERRSHIRNDEFVVIRSNISTVAVGVEGLAHCPLPLDAVPSDPRSEDRPWSDRRPTISQPPNLGYGQPAGYDPNQTGYPGSAGHGPPLKRNNTTLIIAVVVVTVVLVATGVTGFLLLNKDAEPATETVSGPPFHYDGCEELSLPCPAPAAGSNPPTGSGDATVDALAQNCFNDDMQACDELYTATANGSPPSPTPALRPFFDYGYTCGDRLTADEVDNRLCFDIYE